MDWIQSFYFSVVTLTTVGYGDLHPTTEVSRLFTALFVLLGVAIVLVSLGIIWKNYIERRERRILEAIQRAERREDIFPRN
jgi:heme exporter protein D